MSRISQGKKEQAKEYILAHPDESKNEQAKGAHTSPTMIAVVRAELIRDGLLAPSRKAVAPPHEPREPREPREAKTEPTPAKTESLLDHTAMVEMAKLMDEVKDLTDDEVFKRLQNQFLSFAFNPRLHPDTRMTASTNWSKLKERAKNKDLGPGIPLTFEDAVSRLADLMMACGPEIALAAINVAFTVKDKPDEGKVSADSAETPRSTPGPSEAPGSPPDVRPDDGTAGTQPLG